ncbi:MAG: D-glycero-beta-D-manno-heptose 1,7-bisphosphate 7-phosphatase [Anaerolineae bacterium]
MISLSRAAVFLDRDGVINYNRDDYVKRWAEFRFLPGALAALRRLAASPFQIVVVTNQSALGRGLLDPAGLECIHARMSRAVLAAGGRIDRIFYCPHRPEDGCACRKPRPGLLEQAARALNIDLARSYLVGDALSDIQAAQAAGCLPLLVLTGRGAAARQQSAGRYQVVRDLGAAVDWILGRETAFES